jgi:hypothetical protein
MKKKKKQRFVPSCLERYEADDVVCNGDQANEDDAPCGWRDRCSAFQLYLKAKEEKKSKHIKLIIRYQTDEEGQPVTDSETGEPIILESYARAKKGYSVFVAFLDRLVEAWGINEGKPTRKPSPTEIEPVEAVAEQFDAKSRRKYKRPSTAKEKVETPREPFVEDKPIRRGKRGPYQAVAAKKERMVGLFWGFARQLFDQFPEARVLNGNVLATPGQFYVVDRAKKVGGYFAIYCRTSIGRDVPIARVFLKPITETLSVQLPVNTKTLFADVGKTTKGKLKNDAVDVTDGRFKCELKNLDKELSGLLADVIFGLTERGAIQIPEV